MQRLFVLVLIVLALGGGGAPLQSQPARPRPARRSTPWRCAVSSSRDVMVVYGNGKPPFGPMDVVVEDGLIAEVRSSTAEQRPQADVVIDGRASTCCPGS